MQKSAAIPQRLEKEAIRPSTGFNATTAMEWPCNSSIRAGRPAVRLAETALSAPRGQLSTTEGSHSSPCELPAAHTRMTFSSASACAKVAMALE